MALNYKLNKEAFILESCGKNQIMRFITGTARGTRLETLEGETTRPTSERTKEAVFSMLQFDIEGKNVLDLFGGSGQLALEALSRGAVSAYITDSDQAACEIIKRNAKKTRLFEKTKVLCCDYKSVIKNLSGREKFGIVFLDPPYKSNFITDALQRLTEANLISDGGFVICESDVTAPFSYPGFALQKHAKYGKAFITILRKECQS